MSEYVLLIEDNEDDIELTRRALSGQDDLDVLVVKRGEEALEYLYRSGEYASRADQDPALILLDLDLPDMSGLEVLSALRGDASMRHIPIVMLTVSGKDDDRRASYASGTNLFITKPLRYEDFEATVEAIGTFWLHQALTPGRGTRRER